MDQSAQGRFDPSPDPAYRAVSGKVTRSKVASSSALHMEVLDRTSPEPIINWLYRQPVATMMWLRKGFDRFELGVGGTKRRETQVTGDMILYLPPGMDAQGEFAVDTKCSYVAVFFPAEVAELAANQPLIGFDDPAMRAGLLDLRDWADDPGFSIMAEGWTLQTAARLRQHSLQTVSDPDSLPQFNSSRLIEFLRYGGAAPTLTTMARAAQMSRSELMQALWQQIKQTPFEYALRMRMEAAAALLLDTRLSIDEIALRFGYTSTDGFSAAFRRVLGQTPAGYRASAPARS